MMRALFVVGLLTFAGASSVTPVQKVIQLMEGMVAKGEDEKHAEQVQFASYKTFCEQTSASKGSAIAEAAERIDILTADIEKYESDAATLAKGIAALDRDISNLQADQKAATGVRDKEHADFLTEEKDHQESVEQMARPPPPWSRRRTTRRRLRFCSRW
jgi:polyhydroxyalkanoate synthesis regulator phasin